jgi:hypothetical protein
MRQRKVQGFPRIHHLTYFVTTTYDDLFDYATARNRELAANPVPHCGCCLLGVWAKRYRRVPLIARIGWQGPIFAPRETQA